MAQRRQNEVFFRPIVVNLNISTVSDLQVTRFRRVFHRLCQGPSSGGQQRPRVRVDFVIDPLDEATQTASSRLRCAAGRLLEFYVDSSRARCLCRARYIRINLKKSVPGSRVVRCWVFGLL